MANLALHPTKPILVTASDDKTWKMWHMPGAAGGRVQAAGWCKEAGLNGGLVLWGCGGGAGLGIQGWFWVGSETWGGGGWVVQGGGAGGGGWATQWEWCGGGTVVVWFVVGVWGG